MSAEFLGEGLTKAFFFNPDIWKIALEIIALIIIAILCKNKIRELGEYMTPIAAIIYAVWSIIHYPTTTYHCVWVIVLFSISIVFIALRRIIEKFKEIR